MGLPRRGPHLSRLVTLHSDVGGSLLGPIPIAAKQRVTFRRDGNNEWAFDAADGAWRDSAVILQSVVRLDLPYRGISEWRLTGLQRGVGTGRGAVRVQCQSLRRVLRDAGRLRVTLQGGGSRYSLQAKQRPARFYLEEVLLPHMQAEGFDWFGIGDVEDDTTLLSLKWYGKNGQWLVDELCKRTGRNHKGLEQELRRHGHGDHRLHLVERVNGDAEEVVVAEGRNMLSAILTQGSQGLATVIQGFGGVPAGGTERAGSGLASWKVVEPYGDVIYLADRNGGDGPVAITGQYARRNGVVGSGNYLRSVAGDHYEIIASDAESQTVTLVSGGGAAFQADDEVEIRKDSFGTLLDEAKDPATSHRVVENFERDDYRGERNYAPNPFGSTNTGAEPAVVRAQSAGSSTPGGSTLALDGILPSNRTIPEGSVVCVPVAPTYLKVMRTTAPVTASGGAATLPISPALPNMNPGPTFEGPVPNNTEFLIFENPAALPDHWSSPQADTDQTPLVVRRPAGLVDLEGGSVDLGVGIADGPVTITGLGAYEGTADGEVYPGDALVTAVGWQPILSQGTIASGQVTVLLGRHSGTSAGSTGAGTQAASIVRPQAPAREQQTHLTTLVSRKHNDQTTTLYLANSAELDPVLVSPIPGQENVAVQVEILVRGTGGLGLSGAPTVPRVELYDDGVLVAEGAPDTPLNFPAGTGPQDQILVLRAPVALDQARLLKPRVYGPAQNTTQFIGQFFTTILGVGIMVGSDDPNTPVIWGSWGTQIRQDENRHLLLQRQVPEQFSFTVYELKHRFGANPPEPIIREGGSLFARTSLNGNVGVHFRFEEIDVSVDDEADTRFKANSRLEEATELFMRRILESSGGSGSVAGGTILEPGLVTGRTPVPSTGSVHIATSTTRPPANHKGDLVHQTDLLDILQWAGARWEEVLEATRGDLRVALTEGASLAGAYAVWESQRQGWSVDANGSRILLPTSES